MLLPYNLMVSLPSCYLFEISFNIHEQANHPAMLEGGGKRQARRTGDLFPQQVGKSVLVSLTQNKVLEGG
ncbi:hypothetical protein DSCOOX_01310 [Desulfosarcina ovata subsp. ovata]|uniref:Uncharacterized protein n=1 Tax=Desulfosarcina ovata subsp. ovata TaxID=2752305 RepID=A0A5K8A3D1_9BACT|nr:hypothetical protein DSCOOX_01310 [Desulfosarcina ovata subsp. ovata]